MVEVETHNYTATLWIHFNPPYWNGKLEFWSRENGAHGMLEAYNDTPKSVAIELIHYVHKQMLAGVHFTEDCRICLPLMTPRHLLPENWESMFREAAAAISFQLDLSASPKNAESPIPFVSQDVLSKAAPLPEVSDIKDVPDLPIEKPGLYTR